MTNKTVNVSIWIPGPTVSTMTDEVQDGKVAAAVEAVKNGPLGKVDTDGDIPVREYTEDFDNALAEARAYADSTDGADLLVVISDLECDDWKRALRVVNNSDDMFVVVPVSNQGYNEQRAAEIDADEDGDNNVDVVTVENLSNAGVALAEVNTWLAKLNA